MKEMIILADDVRVQAYNSKTEVTMYNPDFGLNDIMTNQEIVDSVDDLYSLFEAVIEADDAILHDYLESAGYIFNKG